MIEKNVILALEVGDTFIFTHKYIDCDRKIVKRDYECHILAVIVDGGALQGFTTKRYMKGDEQWLYEFFHINRVASKCKTS